MNQSSIKTSATFLLVSLLITWLTGCFDSDLTPLPFFEVEMAEANPIDLGSIELRAILKVQPNQEVDTEINYGFIITESNTQPQLTDPDLQLYRVQQGDPNRTAFPFDTTLNLSILPAVYYAWAFAEQGARLVISSTPLAFSFQLEVALGNFELQNDSVFMSGFVFGIDAFNTLVDDHGHLIAPQQDKLPEAGQPDVRLIPLGEASQDGSFESRAGDLSFNTTHVIRAYALFNNEYVYSDTAHLIVRDGWKRRASFPKIIYGAFAASTGVRAFLGVGCGEGVLECLPTINIREFMEFQPGNASSEGQFLPRQTFSRRHRINSAGFHLRVDGHDLIYLGFGTSPQEYAPAVLLDDFNVYDVQNDRWSRAAAFPGGPREAAVAFALNGKGYIGFGKGADSVEKSDFYEFDPAGNSGTGSWRQIKSLGFALEENDIRPAEGGRRESIAFVINGERAYVGLGKNGVNFLNDLWEFIPPVDENDPGDWRLVGFLPDQREGREGAVAFAINGKAYIGTGGQNTRFEYYNDFWEFDPDEEAFRRREPLPGPRWQGVAFTIGNRAFAGTGQFRFRVQRAPEIDTFNDIWEYIPEEE